MHAALLLDDVLRQIFDFCPRLPTAAARTCKSWSDPAIDAIWCHVHSLAPLFSLIPGVLCVDGVYKIAPGASVDLTAFNFYASRIKHITQRHDIRIHPALLALISQPGTPILTRLISTRLSSTDPHSIPAALSLCPTLRQVDLDLCFKQRSNDDAGDYIEKLLDATTNVERVRLRGSASRRLNDVISRASHLQSLALRTGTFLTEDTLVAISSFPSLSELDFEGSHLDVDALSKAWSLPAQGLEYFQALEKLHVRAQAPVLELLLKTLSSSASLRTLRIEVTSPDREPPVCWSSIFDLIRLNAPQTENLTIEQHLDDIDLDSTGADTHPSLSQPTGTQPPNQITFDIIRLLAPLRRLRSLTIDMTRIPSLCDRDIETLATWWPALTHLDLGLLPSSECILPASSPRATLTCLGYLSSMPMLQNVIIPLSIGDAVPVPRATASNPPSALSGATFSSPAPPNPAALAPYLRALFPALKQVEGGLDRHDGEWGQVNSLLSAARAES